VLALAHPIYPFISYLIFYYMPPEKNWWGEHLPNLRWSLIASAVMLGSVLMKSGSLERLKPTKNPALLWLLAFGANIIVVTAWAENRARSWYWTVALLKIIVLYTLMPVVIRTPAQFDMFAAAHIGGASYWGWKAWDEPKISAGRLKDVGGPDTQNENAAAAHVLTVLPFVAVYAFSVKRRWLQGLIALSGAFIVNMLILCNSRGSIVALLAMCGAAVLLVGKGRRWRLIAVGLCGVAMLGYLANDRFIQRQQTTVAAQDGSSQGRLEAWAAGLRFMRDHPLGTGGRGFHILSAEYIPDIVEDHNGEERSVHDTYLQLSAEWGVQGLITWGGFIATTLLMLRRSRKDTTNDENPWFFYRFFATELALIGTLIAGVFTSRLYGESLYWMCSLAFVLRRMHATATSEEQPAIVEVIAAPVRRLGARLGASTGTAMPRQSSF
jgi:hypothetical protein